MRFDALLLFCLLAALTLWVVQVVATCRDRGMVPRVTIAMLAAKATLAILKQFRQLTRV
jgi:hypothetical protein